MSSAFSGDASFVSGAFVKDVPFLGGVAKNLGCVFVPRGGNKEQLGKSLDGLLKRTEEIEAGSSFPTITIFPEGTCTNNTCLIKFRRGAFYDLRSLVPVTVKYKFGMVSPAVDALEMSYAVFLICASLQSIVAEVTEMPPFEPNDYLFEKHADKGKEKWEIFAWATRDAMAKVGGFGQHDLDFKERIATYEYYTGKINEIKFSNGESVTYREDGDYSEKRKKE